MVSAALIQAAMAGVISISKLVLEAQTNKNMTDAQFKARLDIRQTNMQKRLSDRMAKRKARRSR